MLGTLDSGLRRGFGGIEVTFPDESGLDTGWHASGCHRFVTSFDRIADGRILYFLTAYGEHDTACFASYDPEEVANLYEELQERYLREKCDYLVSLPERHS